MNGELADDPLRYVCSNCEARITHIKWANQHGQSVRFFCDVCGMWEDRKLIYGKGVECRTGRAALAQAPVSQADE